MASAELVGPDVGVASRKQLRLRHPVMQLY